jgi:hypothetical protein
VYATGAHEVWPGDVDVVIAEPHEIEERCGSADHQGLCAEVGPYPYVDADSLLAAEDAPGYILAVESVLESFETRDEYLEDVPVADTVLVLQALAERRGLQADLDSPLLPEAAAPGPAA